jgi:hypothetical protein
MYQEAFQVAGFSVSGRVRSKSQVGFAVAIFLILELLMYLLFSIYFKHAE